MYFGALILLPDGSKKIVNGMMELLKYAKKENKLIKIVCDNTRAIDQLQKALKKMHPNATVEFGVEGMLELELNEDAK